MKVKAPGNIEKYQEHYTEKGLFAKLGKVCKKAGQATVYYALILFYVLKDENTSLEHKAIILGALGYFIFPLDMIPDFIPFAGYGDDMAALIACIRTIKANITPQVKKNAAQKLYDWFDTVEYSKIDELDIEDKD